MTQPTSSICEPCTEYREGKRENLHALGTVIHVCLWKREGTWSFDACPCGCELRPATAPVPFYVDEED